VELDQSRQMVQRRVALFRIHDVLATQLQAQTICLTLFTCLGYTTKEVLKMGRVRRRTVRWEPSADAKKYRLYWSTQGPVGYESDFVELENKTMAFLPDEVPSFPTIAGNIELGITAVNEVGNESDITIARVYVNFTVPDAPKVLTVED